VVGEIDTSATAPGYLLVACGNRRASRCEACAKLYKEDTFHLIRAGLIGGKGVPEDVRRHPRLFVTLTAPSFGAVHVLRTTPEGMPLPCRPRRDAPVCVHQRASSCGLRHAPDDPRLGQPLCPDCYDYRGAVLWNAHAGELWRRTTVYIRAELAKRLGISRKALSEQARISYAKVAEFQRRGLVHFHVVVRLDGPQGPVTPAPEWADAALLAGVIGAAARATSVRCRPPMTDVFRWGDQLDIRPVAPSVDSERAVAAYVAKYATKAAEVTGTVDARITSPTQITRARISDHARAMMTAAWTLGGNAEYGHLKLRQWTHMLGYRGHFSTKSRAYSTTLGALRQARVDHQAREGNRSTVEGTTEEIASEASWVYLGQGYLTEDQRIVAEGIWARRGPSAPRAEAQRGEEGAA